MTVAEYLRMPWTIERSVHDDDGTYIALHVRELPGFVAAGRTEEEVEQSFWDALPAFLESYLADGEPPPLPNALLSHLPQLDLGMALEVPYSRPSLTTWYPEQGPRSLGSGRTQRYTSSAASP
jgi:predicted RNase H-like HicB family nuclease